MCVTRGLRALRCLPAARRLSGSMATSRRRKAHRGELQSMEVHVDGRDDLTSAKACCVSVVAGAGDDSAANGGLVLYGGSDARHRGPPFPQHLRSGWLVAFPHGTLHEVTPFLRRGSAVPASSCSNARLFVFLECWCLPIIHYACRRSSSELKGRWLLLSRRWASCSSRRG